MEGNHPRRGGGDPPLPDHQGGQQAAPPHLRQADDLLSALRPDAFRHPGHPAHLHADRPAPVPGSAGGRFAVGDPDLLRGTAAPRRPGAGVSHREGVHRPGQGVPDPRRQHFSRSRVPADPEAGVGDRIGRDHLRVSGSRSRAVRRRRVRPVGKGAEHRGEAEAAEVEIRRSRSLLLRQRGGGDRGAVEAVGARGAGDRRM